MKQFYSNLILIAALFLSSMRLNAQESMTFTKITSIDYIEAGAKYLFVYDDDKPYAMSSIATNTSTKRLTSKKLSYNDNKQIVTSDETVIWTLEADGDNFKIKQGSNYVTGTGSGAANVGTLGNTYVVSSNEDGTFKFVISSNSDRIIRFNDGSSYLYFAHYGASSKLKMPSIYKEGILNIPTSWDVNFSDLGYQSWGKSTSFSGTTYDEVTQQSNNGVTLNYKRNDGSLYSNNTAIRFYKTNELTISAPEDYIITSVVISGTMKDDIAVDDNGALNVETDKLNWNGCSTNLTFTRSSNADSYATFNSIKVNIKKGVATNISNVLYSTYYNSLSAYIMPEGCEGLTAKYADGTLALNPVYKAGDVVPAGEPLIIRASESGKKAIVFVASNAQPSTDNDLLGTDESTALEADDTSYFYALSLNKGGDPNSVGFYWMNETGAAFTNGAHKAYLKLAKPAASKIKQFVFADDATAISTVSNAADDAEAIYSVSGARQNTMKKGINIVKAGGRVKKVYVK